MKHIKKFNEADRMYESKYDEIQDLCEGSLAFLLDEGYEFNIRPEKYGRNKSFIFLLHKLIKYGIKPADIIVTHGKKPWEMRVVDISDDWRGKFAWAYNFDEVCYQLGIDSPKDNMNGSEVHLAYYQGKLEQIKDYCESDVSASIKASELIYSS